MCEKWEMKNDFNVFFLLPRFSSSCEIEIRKMKRFGHLPYINSLNLMRISFVNNHFSLFTLPQRSSNITRSLFNRSFSAVDEFLRTNHKWDDWLMKTFMLFFFFTFWMWAQWEMSRVWWLMRRRSRCLTANFPSGFGESLKPLNHYCLVLKLMSGLGRKKERREMIYRSRKSHYLSSK